MERTDSIVQFEAFLKRRFPGSRTAKDYVSDVRQLERACPKEWRDVTMHDIDTFVDQQRQAGRSAATVKRRVAALKTFFDFLAEESGELKWDNPVRFKRHAGKQPRRLPRDLSNEKIEHLYGRIESARDRAWFVLMWRAGLRVGEVASLKVTDVLTPAVNEQAAQLKVKGKGQKERIVLLSADAYAVLAEWLACRPKGDKLEVFLNERGQPLKANGIAWLLKGYGQQVEMHVSPHQLRHTFARQVTEAGMPITSLSKLLGHEQISTTQIYTAGADPHLREAYQQAMVQMASPSAIPTLPSTPIPAPAAMGESQTGPTVPSPAQPDEASWATHLPSALRQATLDYFRPLAQEWHPHRRRLFTLRRWGEVRRFWEWLCARRTVTQPCEVSLADLRAFQTECLAQGTMAHTINCILAHILNILRQQNEQGLPVDPSVFRLRALPRAESLPRHLSEHEAQTLDAHLLRRLDTPDAIPRLENACFAILAYTGLRASECIDLLIQDVDLAGHRLVVRQGKGMTDRVVYLSELTCRALTPYLSQPEISHAPSAAFFQRPNHSALKYAWLCQHLTTFACAAGVTNLTPHRLRHTLATRLLNRGMAVTRIQKLLGHKHLNTTMIYARVSDATVEADYRSAMRQIELQAMPLSSAALPAEGWPLPSVDPSLTASVNKGDITLDNSI